jgi:glycosyltransferase involved in cell wall biosynthesis
MFSEKKIAVVVPAYNESKLIMDTLQTIPNWVDKIYAVNDASTDETLSRMKHAASNQKRIRVIDLQRNSGVGGSIVEGYKAALIDGMDICCVMAGDGQMDPSELHKLVEPITKNQTDMAKGNRFYSNTSFLGMPRGRIVGNVILSILTKIGSGYWSLIDPQNGYVAVSRVALEKMQLEKLSKRYDFENDFLCQFRMIDGRVMDVPIPARYGNETSTLNVVMTAWRISKTLWRGFWRRLLVKHMLWSFSLIPIFFLLGSLMLSVGTALGIWAIIHSLGPSSASAGTVTLVSVLTLSGLQLILVGLVLDIISEPKVTT